jgi:hypothetical protein
LTVASEARDSSTLQVGTLEVSCEVGKNKSLGLAIGPTRWVSDRLKQYLLIKESYVEGGAEHQRKVGGSKSTQELCEKSRGALDQRGPFYALRRWCSVKSTSQRPHLSYPALYILVTLHFTSRLPYSSHSSYPVRQGNQSV